MSDDYEVGYGKPPKHTRFKKGKSGNPGGRPKGTKNFKTDFEEELRSPIRVREGGKAVVMSKQRAMVKGLTAKALQGDLKALGAVTQLALRFSPEERDTAAMDDALGREEQEVMDQLMNRLRTEAVEEAATEPAEPEEGKPTEDEQEGEADEEEG